MIKQGHYWGYLFTVWVVATCLALAYWQWLRAGEKQSQLSQMARWQKSGPLTLNRVNDSIPSGTRTGITIATAGQFHRGHYWLLDNKTHQGQAGYNVIALWQPAPQTYLTSALSTATNPSANSDQPTAAFYLVNLGWLAAPAHRAQLPEVSIPKHPQLLEAVIYEDYQQQFTLGDHSSNGWPKRIQRLQAEQLQRDIKPLNLAGELHTDFLLIAQNTIANLQPHFTPVVMPPAKHIAYMWQWLLLALAALLVALYNSPLRRYGRQQPASHSGDC